MCKPMTLLVPTKPASTPALSSTGLSAALGGWNPARTLSLRCTSYCRRLAFDFALPSMHVSPPGRTAAGKRFLIQFSVLHWLGSQTASNRQTRFVPGQRTANRQSVEKTKDIETQVSFKPGLNSVARARTRASRRSASPLINLSFARADTWQSTALPARQ